METNSILSVYSRWRKASRSVAFMKNIDVLHGHGHALKPFSVDK